MSFSRSLLILLFFALPITSLAHGKCTGHDPAPDSHYNAANHPRGDRDGDGRYCENSPRSQTSTSQSTSTTSRHVTTTTSQVSPTPTPIPVAQPAQIHVGGITVAPENRCTPYDRGDYYYPPSIELRIIAENLGGRITSPYTGESFASRSETDIEHIVATSEAHDSGLCAASLAVRRQFAQDLLNLTLASPSLNRYDKSGKDLAEWLPGLNRCWFVETVVAVKAKYHLTMDDAEAAVARQVLGECDDTASESILTAESNAGVVHTPPTVTVVQLLHSANFRARPGIENAIVGGGRAGVRFPFVTTAGDSEGAHWHQVRLPRGWGWIRADLATLINP